MKLRRILTAYLPLALAIALVGSCFLLCGAMPRLVVHDTSSPLKPRPPTDHRRLAADVNRLLVAPSGGTMTLAAGDHELESFLNYYALPRASLGVLRVAIAFGEGQADFTMLLGDATPMATLALTQATGMPGPEVAVTDLHLGSLPAPRPFRTLIARILNDTFRSGDAGFTLQSLALREGEAQITVTRR